MKSSNDHISSGSPFPQKEEVMRELRIALLCHASYIALALCDGKLASEFAGFTADEWENIASVPEAVALMDLERFSISKDVSRAYDFAYQVGDLGARAWFGIPDLRALHCFHQGAARVGLGGEIAPLASGACALGTMIDAAWGRMLLRDGKAVTVRQIALLVGLDETVVRVSLRPKEPSSSECEARIPADRALAWLKTQATFRPTLIRGDPDQDYPALINQALRTCPFENALEGALSLLRVNCAQFAELAGVDFEWLCGLRGLGPSDQPFVCDVAALRRVAMTLRVDVSLFVRRGIEAILRPGTARPPLGNVALQ